MGLNPDGLGRTETFGDAALDDPAPVFDERVEDIIGALVTGGTNVTVSYNDAGDTLTVNTSALDEEEVEDAVAALLSAGSGISLNYNDAGDTLTVSVNESGLSFYDGTNLTADVNNSAVTTERIHNTDRPITAVIWKDGSTFYAGGRAGLIDSGSNAATVIQSAADALNDGEALAIQSAVYPVDTTIRFGGVKVVGEGRNATTGTVLRASADLSGPVVEFYAGGKNTIKHPTIEDVRIDTNSQTNTDGLVIARAYEGTISRVVVDNCDNGTSLRLLRSFWITVEDSYFDSANKGCQVGYYSTGSYTTDATEDLFSNQCRFDNVEIKGTGGTSIEFVSGRSHTFENCDFSNSNGVGVDIHPHTSDASEVSGMGNIYLINPWFEGNSTAVKLHYEHTASGGTVHGNFVTGAVYDGVTTEYDITTSSAANDFVLEERDNEVYLHDGAVTGAYTQRIPRLLTDATLRKGLFYAWNGTREDHYYTPYYQQVAGDNVAVQIATATRGSLLIVSGAVIGSGSNSFVDLCVANHGGGITNFQSQTRGTPGTRTYTEGFGVNLAIDDAGNDYHIQTTMIGGVTP